MAIAYRRIIDQLDDTELQSGDYIMVDSETEGTRKYDLGTGMSGKVDKETGKGLSTEDYTTAEKTKLSEVEAQANKTIIDATLANTGQAADAKKVGDELTAVKEDLEQLEPGLSEEAKAALLACFENVAWANQNGQTYYDALQSALNTGEYPKLEVVFTQGNHTVYAGTSIDTLKPYLTVIYKEDASTSRVLADSEYTLSGSLVSGSNSIQAAYSTLTKRFIVPAVNSGLPSGYTPYDYIRVKPLNEINSQAYSTYANGQLFIYGLSPMLKTRTFTDLFALNYHFKSKIDTSVNAGDAFRPFFGGRIAASNDAKSEAIYRKGGNQVFSVHTHGNNIQFNYTFDPNAMYDYKLINPAQSPSVLKINDEAEFEIPWVNKNVVNYHIGLFTNFTSSDTDSNINNWHLLGTIEITDRQDDMVAKYIPVKRDADNVVGIYDTVAQEFRTSTDAKYATQGNTYCIYGVGNWS